MTLIQRVTQRVSEVAMPNRETPANGHIDTAIIPGDKHPAPPEKEVATGEAPPDTDGTGSAVRQQPPMANGADPADAGRGPAPSFLNGKSAAAVFFALAYWVTVYCLPGSKVSLLPPEFSWLFVGIAFFALTLSGLA